MDHAIVSREEWLAARLDLLEKEKAHSRARDELTRARQNLPWVKRNGPQKLDSALSEIFLGFQATNLTLAWS